MFLRTEIPGLQKHTDVLVLENGSIYQNLYEPDVNSFARGTINVIAEAEECVSTNNWRVTYLEKEIRIKVVFKPLKPLLPRRFNILATANNGQLIVKLTDLSISKIDTPFVIEKVGYKGATLTCYAEGVRVLQNGI